MPRDARPMRQHVAQSDRVVQVAVVELDRWHGLLNRPVPGELSFFDQHSRRDRCEQLSVRCNCEHRLRRNGKLLLIISKPVPLREHELVADDNTHADARRIPVFQSLLHKRIKARELLRHVYRVLGELVLSVA